MNNTVMSVAVVAGIIYYIKKSTEKPPFINPIPKPGTPDSIINPDNTDTILDPTPGQIEDIWNNKTTNTTTPTTTTPTNTTTPTTTTPTNTYPGQGYAEAYSGVVTPTTNTPTTTTSPGGGFLNPTNPFDPSGFDPGVYAGGYEGSYAAYG